MNNCRAGLYSFASTTTWLRERGMASPPFLVMLGLTLPDSRILSGIAGIGLTLANIAIILPHLRQPILDSMHASEGELTHPPSTQEQTELSLEESNPTQPVDLKVESPALASASPCDSEHQRAPLTCSAIVKSVCSAVTEPLECLDVDSEVVPHAVLPLPAGKTDGDQIPPQIHRSPHVDSTEKLVSSNHLLMREGRSALHIPLPVPDAVEVAFFETTDTSLSKHDLDLGEASAPCEQHTVPEEDSTIENDGPMANKGIEQGSQLVTADLPSTPGRAEIGEDLTDVAMPVADKNVAPTTMNVAVRDHHNPVQVGTTSHLQDGLAARGGILQGAQAGHSMVGGKEVLAKRRPESLTFIPQSVIRRYPSAPMVSTRRCFGHRAFTSSGHDHQFTPAPPHTLVHDPAMLPGGSTPQTSYTASEGCWRAAFLTEVQPNTRSMGGQTLVIETVLAQDPLIKGLASPPEPPTVHELTPLKKYPTHKRRLGVLARAALRNRRFAARRCRSDGIDGSSTSDSDSDCDSDSDSQYSSGSSADESMLPHMLGADLIAAIDANSESELNLDGPRRTIRTPLDMYEDFLVSEASAADVSMIMHVSSNDDASDGEVKPPVTLRSLTYEDIQQWASGVVQKCVRQVCRSRAPVEPLSPSQASDVCAERPSSSGISQCPLSGLHCKLGAAALAQVPAPRSKELLVSLPPTSILPTRKPMSVRNVRDIPEFVPRQRHVSVITGRVESLQGPNTRSTIDVTRDAATEVIVRMETQASSFNTQQWLAGMDETRRVGTVRGCQGTPRRA